MQHEYYIADAFTETPLQGAQIAVFPHADGLDTAQMRRLAAELNLSETVFLSGTDAPDGERAIRVFSTHRELEPAGHALVAVAFVLAHAGELNGTDGESQLHLVRDHQRLELSLSWRDGSPAKARYVSVARPTVDRFVPPRDELASILGVGVREVNSRQPFVPLMVACERPYLVVPLTGYETIRSAAFDYRFWSQSLAPTMLADELLIFSNHSGPERADFHCRLVGPHIAPDEDPPVGAAMPAFAAYLCAHDHIREGTHVFTVSRGTSQQRLSLLDVEMDNLGGEELTVRLGGPAVVVAQGSFWLPAAA